jgi:hypothetical protein
MIASLVRRYRYATARKIVLARRSERGCGASVRLAAMVRSDWRAMGGFRSDAVVRVFSSVDRGTLANINAVCARRGHTD